MSRKSLFRLIYILISLFAFYYLAKRILGFEQWDVFSWGSINESWFYLILIQAVLWFLNIGLEALKWKYLLSPLANYSFSVSLKMVFAGFTAGSITPMKLGEHGGKIIYLRKEDHTSGIMASVYGSYLNTAVLLLTSFIVLPALLSKNILHIDTLNNISTVSYLLIVLAVLAGSYVLMLFFFKSIKTRIRGSKWAVKKSFFENFRSGRSLMLFLLTLARVLTYNIQLFVWFRFFNIACPPDIFFLLSLLYFAVITVIPAMFLLDLGIRGSVGLFIFSSQCGSPAIILAALFSLWFINVAIPVFTGNILLILKTHHR